MTKDQKDNAIKLLFEIYDAGVENKTIDLTGYLNDITKALNEEESYEESGLKHPEKADLNDDGVISDYEKKRGKAIENSIEEESEESEENNETNESSKYDEEVLSFDKFFSKK